jgi:hypothetical protein
MKSVTMLSLAGAACALLLAFPAAAAQKTKAAASAKATASAKSTPAKSVLPKKANARRASLRTARRPETLSGKIFMVEPDRNLVVVKGPDGVPFDMVVSRRTHIESGSEAITLKNLAQYQNKNASIRFVPERRGDVAESIRITG